MFLIVFVCVQAAQFGGFHLDFENEESVHYAAREYGINLTLRPTDIDYYTNWAYHVITNHKIQAKQCENSGTAWCEQKKIDRKQKESSTLPTNKLTNWQRWQIKQRVISYIDLLDIILLTILIFKFLFCNKNCNMANFMELLNWRNPTNDKRFLFCIIWLIFQLFVLNSQSLDDIGNLLFERDGTIWVKTIQKRTLCKNHSKMFRCSDIWFCDLVESCGVEWPCGHSLCCPWYWP